MNKVLINGLLINDKNAGIGSYGYNLINRLVDKATNYDVSVLSQGVINYYNASVINKPYDKPYKRILAEQISLLKEYKKHDLIHFIDYSSPLLGLNIPFIVTIHDLSYYKYPETFTFGSRKIKELIAPSSIRRASRIVADSLNTKKDILSLFDINEERIKVIYPGRPDYQKIHNISQIESIKRKYGISGDYILYLGTLEPRKNIVRLVQAYGRLVREHHITDKLVIAGQKGWMYDDIFEKVKELALENRVIFTGFVDEEDKPLLYSGAKLFVYPSLYEGFGLPPLEAMTCKVPVVVSNTSSLPEVVGESGIYIDPLDIDSISKGIYDIITDDELRKRLSGFGKKQSIKFDWDIACKQILDVYDEILR